MILQSRGLDCPALSRRRLKRSRCRRRHTAKRAAQAIAPILFLLLASNSSTGVLASEVRSSTGTSESDRSGVRIFRKQNHFVVKVEDSVSVDQILQQMQSHLRVPFINIRQIDLTRRVSGERSGSVKRIMEWLVPTGGFVLSYHAPAKLIAEDSDITQITFVAGAGPSFNPAMASSLAISPAPAVAPSNGTRSSVGTQRAQTDDTSQNVALPRGNDNPVPATRPLSSPGGVATGASTQQTAQQQLQRTQASATSQVQALLAAFRAACVGAPNGIC